MVTTLLAFVFVGTAGGEDATVVENRLSQAARYLASDELEGRGVGTQGLNAAAEYIAEQFRAMGLKTDLYDGAPFQKFKMTTGATLGATNTVAFVGPAPQTGQEPRQIELKLAVEFTPLAIGGSGKFDLPLVFAGYGITAKDEKYDDYAGIDVRDKAVIVLRHEPQQANPHSTFGGTENSPYATYNRKVSNAYEHGAAAVIFCTDDFEIEKTLADARRRWQTAYDELAPVVAKFKALAKPSAEVYQRHEQQLDKLVAGLKRYSDELRSARDPLIGFDAAKTDANESRDFPVLNCQRGAVDQVIASALGTTLGELERQIDRGPTPHSHALNGWRIVGETNIARQETEVKNVVGVLEATGPHANETIVIGAHYDHLGWGGSGSTAPGVHEIHNGADDNGSGTTVLIEVARQLSRRSHKLARRIVFIAFTGEERGLMGSAHYVRNPLFPIESTVAMLNMDMVGRLQDEKLIVYGTSTATEFDALVDRMGTQHGFKITKKPGGFGPSDHSSFYAAQVPVLFFFTGSHKDYHRPSDDFEKLNIVGMRRVADVVIEIAQSLAEAPEHVRTISKQRGEPRRSAAAATGDATSGSIPDFSQDQPGYALSGATKDSPADRAGLRSGDIIIQLADSKIGNLEDFDSALRKHKAGEKVPVVVKRGAEQLRLEVTLDPPR